MTGEADTAQSLWGGKAAIVIFLAVCALASYVAPALARAMTYLYNLMNSFFTSMFHTLLPGMDWL